MNRVDELEAELKRRRKEWHDTFEGLEKQRDELIRRLEALCASARYEGLEDVTVQNIYEAYRLINRIKEGK